MITKNEIIQLIEAASRQALAQYNYDAEKFDKPSIKNLLGAAQQNLYNERTIAYHFNKYIELSMVQSRRPYYFVSEARIKYKSSENEVKKAESEIEGLDEKSPQKISVKEHDTFIPDALVMVPGFRSRPIYCIEYKVSDKFEYLKLAADFLKYKYYSGAFDRASAFVYILLFREGKSLGMKGVQELQRILRDEKAFREKSLFYYLGEMGSRKGSRTAASSGESVSILDKKDYRNGHGVSFAAAVMANVIIYSVDMIQFDEKYKEIVKLGVIKLAKILKIGDYGEFSNIIGDSETQLRFLREVLRKYA